MTLLADVVRWFAIPPTIKAPTRCRTPPGTRDGLRLAVLVGVLVALPIGLYLGHTGRFGFVA